MIGLVELDPNQAIVVFGTILAALIAQLGVMLQHGRRLKGVERTGEQVAHEVTENGGGNLRGDLSLIVKRMDRLETEQAARWEVAVETSKVLHQVHANQEVGFAAAQDLLKEVAAVKQAQAHHDQRMTNLESRTTDKLSQMEKELAALARRIELLTPSLDTLHPTPPHGQPAVPGK
jgi:hypothetical protein